MFTFVFELSLPIHPTLIPFTIAYTCLPQHYRFNLHTALLPKWWKDTFLLTNPCFSPDPGHCFPNLLLQTCYSLTLDIASLIHSIFQNHLHHPEVVDCFIFSLIKYRQKWSCDPWHQKLRDICDTDVCEGRDRVCGCLKSVQIHNFKTHFLYFNLYQKYSEQPKCQLRIHDLPWKYSIC